MLRLLRRLLEQTIDSHDRRRHFAIQTAVDIDQIVWLYVLFVKRGDRDNNGDDAAFITKLITVISLPLEQIAAQRNGRAIVHGFRLLNGHDPAILDAAIAVIEFVRRRRRGIWLNPPLSSACATPTANRQAMANASFSSCLRFADDENKAAEAGHFTKSIVLISSNIRMSLSLRSGETKRGKILMIKNQQPCPIVDENERSLRFEYRFRRYGIIVLSLIILTALSGLWSSGYFSEAHRETGGGELSVDYQRYAGLMSETELNIQIKPDTASDTIISFAARY